MTIGRKQHQLRANDDAVGQRQAASAALQHAAHLRIEFDRCGHPSHAITFVNLSATPSSRQNLRRGAL
ncbi:MAG: hypothetical protein LC777_15170, partial [Actinobacteria bacterium]|nr:hypothetical protein [Actinomycetota bacterium]